MIMSRNSYFKSANFVWVWCVILAFSISLSAQVEPYHFNQVEPFPAQHVNCLEIDQQGMKWAGTEKGLVGFMDDENFIHYHEGNSNLRDNQINCILIDQEDNKWMGSYGKGLMLLDKAGYFHHFPFVNHKILLITSLTITKNGHIYAATASDGIYVLKDEKLYPVWRTTNSRLPSNRVNFVHSVGKDSLLIGTAKGLCEVYEGRWKNNSKLENVKGIKQIGDSLYASSITHDGPRFWFREKRKWETVNSGVFTFSFQLKDIIQGNQYLWVVSDRGLVQFDGYQNRLFDNRYGLSEAVSCSIIDKQERLWVGSKDLGLFLKGKKPEIAVKEQVSLADLGPKMGESLRLKHAIFRQSSAILQDSTVFDELQVLVAFLHENPTVLVEVHGHTDNTGSQVKNWELSRKRTEVIVACLVAKGVDSQRIIALWHGENKPLFPNVSERNKQQNRRVEIRLVTQR